MLIRAVNDHVPVSSGDDSENITLLYRQQDIPSEHTWTDQLLRDFARRSRTY